MDTEDVGILCAVIGTQLLGTRAIADTGEKIHPGIDACAVHGAGEVLRGAEIIIGSNQPVNCPPQVGFVSDDGEGIIRVEMLKFGQGSLEIVLSGSNVDRVEIFIGIRVDDDGQVAKAAGVRATRKETPARRQTILGLRREISTQ